MHRTLFIRWTKALYEVPHMNGSLGSVGGPVHLAHSCLEKGNRLHVHPSRQDASCNRKPTIEGAGVKLRRAFGFGDTAEFDPFLLLDDFRNDHPDDYLAGFPWHPHRGIETITYVLAGTVEHGDSLGNRGTLGAGDVQWMTAGSGIMHQEMPQGDAQGRMHGFQLWANLPSSLKMTAPRYQDVKAADIPEVIDDDGTKVRVVCRRVLGQEGPGRGRRRRSALSRHVRAARQAQDASRSRSSATPSPTCSRARARSLPRRSRSAC